MTHHLELLIEYRHGKPLREPVHVEPVAPGVWRILYSPGLVLGIAAGDEFAFDPEDGATRYFGNVYDPSDGITPLRWWEDDA